MTNIFLFIGIFCIALFCILLYVFTQNYTLKYRLPILFVLALAGAGGIILSFVKF